MSRPRPGVAGILLTGGASRRMGREKATITVDGAPLAERTARLLAAVAAPVVEVGPGRSGVTSVPDDDPLAGPLAAIATGARALRAAGHRGGAIVVACDLPLLSIAALELLADAPGDGSVIPRIAGFDQPLIARWAAEDLDRAIAAAEAGERSLRSIPDRSRATIVTEAALGDVDPRAFSDADTPEALAELLAPDDGEHGG